MTAAKSLAAISHTLITLEFRKSGTSAVAFSPDLFSPVLREYSQRIMTAQLGPATAIYHNRNTGYDGNNHNSGKGFYNSYNNGRE